jgi:hypothetical protein
MKLFKTPANEIYGYEEDGSQDYLIPAEYIAVTQSEADAIIAASITAETNKQLALSLLVQTEWALAEDIANPANPPYLVNKADFIAYRSAVRQYVANPVSGAVNWPTLPKEVWAK